ncbi:MAG: DUF5696 domain-containing protein [Bacilli bacterium]|nr:DUF5696 domain-containing protein [Bacilli bacterium]
MKLLKIKYIVPFLLVIAVAIVLVVYFTGGLSTIPLADELAFSNKEVNLDDFTEAASMETFDNNKLVAENDNFEMYIDEATTKISIVDKRTGKTYTTTNDDLTSGYGSNFRLFYYGTNGTQVTTGLNTMTDSVNFYNKTSDTYEKHYSLNYIDGGVQIVYDVGRFTQTYYPDKMRINTMIDQFIGNIRINQEYATETIMDSFGETMSIRVVRYREYQNSGTYSATTTNYDVAKYIQDNLYGEVNPLPDTVDPEDHDLYFNITYLTEAFVSGWGTTINASNYGEEGASPCIVNPFIYEGTKNSLFDGFYKIEVDDQVDPTTDPEKYEFYKLKATSTTQFSALFNLLYDTTERHMVSGKYVYDSSILDDQEKIDELVASKTASYDDIADDPKYYLARRNAGYASRDENGFIYDESDNPVAAYYSIEEAYHENQFFGIEGDLVPVRFRVGMEASLSDTFDGVNFTLLGDTLKEGNGSLDFSDPYSHSYRLAYIDFLPYFTFNDEATSEGMLIIPDGSGAVIKFNNGAQELNYNDFRKKFYGRDMNIAPYQMPDSDNAQKLMLPMYGYIDTTNQLGVIGVVSNGASSSALDAGTLHDSQRSKPYNHAKFQTYFRENEEVSVGTNKWNSSKFNKWSETLNTIDFQYDFMFLDSDELTYSKVAEVYRNYLVDRYDLETNDTTVNSLVDINFLGAYERYVLTLGVKHKVKASLTTFKQAEAILEELIGYNVHNLSVSYRGWSEDGLEYKARSNYEVAKVLGGISDLNTFKAFLYSNNIDFYPEIYVATNKGYDYSFGNMKYTGKSVGASYSTHYPYNLATKVQDKTYSGTNYVSSKYYTSLVDALLPSFKTLDSEGVYAVDLGNVKVSDYQRGAEIYAEMGAAYQKQALSMFKEEIGKVKLSAPFEYALPYVSYAVDVPLFSSQNPIIDYTIPFYQLVVSGLFDYAGPVFNYTGDEKMELLKLLETGSNLQFVFSNEDPKILYDTKYNHYPQTYYANWKAKVVNTKETLDSVDIHGGRLISHELVGGRSNIVKVTYSNDVEILINKSLTTDYVDSINGITVKAKSYLVLSGGQ